MARNGAGTYNLPIGNPVTTGTTISSTWANGTLSDIATALTGSISSDGQTAVSANLPMSGYAHTNVANATIRTMYASAGQVQDNSLQFLTVVSGTNAITGVAAVGMSAYATGQRFSFVAAGANTSATTLNINSIGAKAITKNGTTALVAGDIPNGAVVDVVYDGTQFQLTNPVTIPSGIITMWSGSVASIPGGWLLCDGSNSTPDLRNRFIVGAGSTYAVAATGGSADAITVAHTHTITDPTHTHGGLWNSGAGNASGSGNAQWFDSGSGTLTNVGSSSTGISINSSGSSGTNANLPPYYALAYIMKA